MIYRFLSLPIKKRLIVGYFSSIMLLLLISIASLVSLSLISHNTDELYRKPYTINTYVWTIRTDLNVLEKEMYKLITTNSSGSILKTTAELLGSIQKLGQLLEEDEQALKVLTSLEQNIKALTPIREEILEASFNQDQAGALQVVEEQFIPMITQTDELANELETIAQETALTFIDNSHLIKWLIMIFIVLLAASSIVSALYIARLITRSITEPLQQLEHMMREFAQGNLNVSTAFAYEDEVSRLGGCMQASLEQIRQYIEEIGTSLECLARGDMRAHTSLAYIGDFVPIEVSLQHITRSLNQIFTEIHCATEETTDHALHVHQDAYALADKAHHQVELTHALYDSLSEITIQSQSNKESADTVHLLQEQTTELVAAGTQKISAMTHAIDTLQEASASVQNIISYIDELASESHLLALNATIEAARAGEMGKGFTVIAKEMQRLSIRSANAVKETSRLISHSLSLTQSSTGVVLETAQTFSEIVGHIGLAQETMSTIAATSTDQANELERVFTDLEAFKDTTHQISEFSTTSLAVADRLAAQSQQLKAHLTQFTLA